MARPSATVMAEIRSWMIDLNNMRCSPMRLCSWDYHVRNCEGKVDLDLLKAFLEDSERISAAEQARTSRMIEIHAPEGFSKYCMTRDLTDPLLAARNGFADVVPRIIRKIVVTLLLQMATKEHLHIVRLNSQITH